MIAEKKGVELSVNFIVGLVLAISVFLGGLYLIRMVAGTSDNFLKQKSSDFQNQMEDIACSGNEYVCVGITEKSAKQGQTAVYTLRILNAYNSETSFKVTVETLEGPAGADLQKINFLPRAPDNSYNLASYGSDKIPVAIHSMRGAALGNYQIRVNVSTGEGAGLINPYGASQILYFNVI